MIIDCIADCDKCKCAKHPSTHKDDFDMVISEYGQLDKLLILEIDATCKTCEDKFHFMEKYYDY